MPKKVQTNLGRALTRNKKKVNYIPEDARFVYQTHEDVNQKFKNLKSTLDLDPVSEILQKATLANTVFEVNC